MKSALHPLHGEKAYLYPRAMTKTDLVQILVSYLSHRVSHEDRETNRQKPEESEAGSLIQLHSEQTQLHDHLPPRRE
jgi:hypothetical protein